MNYTAIYYRLISSPDVSGYTELHHILPRCLGGTDEDANLVRLSYDKHRLSHLLLVKMYPGNKDLLSAAWLMTHSSSGKRVSRRLSSWLKAKFIASISGDNSHFKRDNVKAKIAKATSEYLRKYPELHPMKREDVRAQYSEKMRSERNPMKNSESAKKVGDKLVIYYAKNPEKNLMLNPEHREKVNEGLRKWHKDNLGRVAGEKNPMFGRSGELSPVFGKRIINDGFKEKRIPKEDPILDGWKEGRLPRGRKSI